MTRVRIRRRAARSCAVSGHYDRVQTKHYDVFAGTAIGADPTPNRSRYVTLYFDFSGPDNLIDATCASTTASCVMNRESQ